MVKHTPNSKTKSTNDNEGAEKIVAKILETTEPAKQPYGYGVGKLVSADLTIPKTLDVHIEFSGDTRGRWFVDAARHANSVEVWAGKAHLIITVEKGLAYASGVLVAIIAALEKAGAINLIELI